MNAEDGWSHQVRKIRGGHLYGEHLCGEGIDSDFFEDEGGGDVFPVIVCLPFGKYPHSTRIRRIY